MNTNQLKTYAPKARLKFIEAIKTKLRNLGIEDGKIAEVERSGDFIFIQKQPFPKSIESARQQIIQKIEKLDFEHVLEQYAYTWFNRLCAIRFMELHEGYLDHGYRVLSHSQREQGLEFLDSAVEVAEYFGLDSKEIIDLKLEHEDEQLYRKLLLAQCNQLHQAMPFLFDPIDSVTSLLLPDDLTRSDSIIMDLVQQVDEDSWQHVEIIGWLYQFYISDLKDEVIGKVVATEDIPYATQLFTPNWIVKYMVQNSLGRYWLQTYPNTIVKINDEEKLLKEVLEYYIEPAEQEDSVKAQLAEITPQSIDPTTIKVIDPASGSGHILVEAYDLLKLIYQSQGHRERDIPKLILENNIFGLDIDDRAEQLTGFALMMKARYKNPRLFSKKIKLNICAFQNSDELNVEQIWQALNLNKAWKVGSHVDMFGQAQANLGAEETDPRYALIQDLVEKFKDAKAFGSLLSVDNSHEATLFDLKTTLTDLIVNGDSLQKGSAEKLLPIVEQAWILSQRYDAVIANPPFLDDKYFVPSLKKFVKSNYVGFDRNLYSAFIGQSLKLVKNFNYAALVTPLTWMFTSSYTETRKLILENHSFITSVRPSYTAFFEVATVQFVVNVIQKSLINYKSTSFDLGYLGSGKEQSSRLLNKIIDNDFSINNSEDFKVLPNSIIAFWLSIAMKNAFKKGKLLGDIAKPRQGMATANNDYFVKFWFEIDFNKIGLNFHDRESALKSQSKWFPYNKGGGFRKWYGNTENVVNWENDGELIRNYFVDGKLRSRPQNLEYFFKPSLTWSLISSYEFGVRLCDEGFLFDVGGSSAFPETKYRYLVAAFLCSKLCSEFMQALNPSANMQVGNVSSLPFAIDEIIHHKNEIEELVKNATDISFKDWASNENTYEFKNNGLVSLEKSTESSFLNFLKQTKEYCENLKETEYKINKIFNSIYEVDEEVSSTIENRYITLNSNPYYRYGGEATEEQLEQRLQSDTIAELISYAIGCMMGRYSLDREGLVYAHEGNTGFDQLVAEGAYKTFPADDDGILPLLDEERFPDDVYSRFEQFIATAWDKETLQQNLDFIADSLRLYNIKAKNGESSAETIRRYLSNHFYKDQHLKTYKNRPIYWLFSSGKQKAFECLVYMHRFNETTLAKMRTQYVLPLMGQLTGRAQFLADADKDTSLSPAEKTKYAKEADSLHKKLNELKDFDAELKHHIEQKISIDLDDGVKVNYGKFEKLLAEAKKVTGNKA